MIGTMSRSVRTVVVSGLLALSPSWFGGDAQAATCGDVTGDTAVDVGDALAIAQVDVGSRRCNQLAHPESCDVNGDGACNFGDVLRIMQCEVGLRSCALSCRPFTCPVA